LLLSIGWSLASLFLLGSIDPMIQRLLMTLGFAGIFLLLVSCQGSDYSSNSSPETQTGQIVPSLPSISEIAGTPSPEIPPLPSIDPDEIALGKKVYAENCAECHGENLEGESNWKIQNEDDSFRSPPHDDTGHTWHHGDKVLIESIELGGARLPANIGGFSNMPAFEDTLTEDEITAVLNYIKSTWPDDIRTIQWEQTVREQSQ
jgi:mono/diheme cytochrome c family protein